MDKFKSLQLGFSPKDAIVRGSARWSPDGVAGPSKRIYPKRAPINACPVSTIDTPQCDQPRSLRAVSRDAGHTWGCKKNETSFAVSNSHEQSDRKAAEECQKEGDMEQFHALQLRPSFSEAITFPAAEETSESRKIKCRLGGRHVLYAQNILRGTPVPTLWCEFHQSILG